ncbi:response regulator transcription factor [Mycobacterium sp. OTB74]|uniref:LytR/AlgR family response regulator transcription factor n=1 Tax=Mycobacterium sp. OTB74 TaxID=1853452 RepID=UPI00247DAF91|nr:two-component system nitrate/nitrite response regulator NarL [Mycobacterium sp. OTB74]
MQLRCLLVDDNAQFLDAARRLLEHGGLDVVGTATTSAEALRSARELRPDVTLVDVHLGEESGFDLAHQLRQDSHPAVILTSATPVEEFEESLADSPALGFIVKSALSAGIINELVGAVRSSSSG